MPSDSADGETKTVSKEGGAESEAVEANRDNTRQLHDGGVNGCGGGEDERLAEGGAGKITG